jgi:multidrug transporter EmrE-like cation transporter
MHSTLLVLLITIIGISWNILLQKYTRTRSNLIILLILIVDIVYFNCYIKLLRQTEISSIYPVLKIISLISMVLIGIFLFDESIGAIKIGGLAFAIGAIYLLTCNR